jgi:hypothetical protein
MIFRLISFNDDNIALKGSKGPLANQDVDSPPVENTLIEAWKGRKIHDLERGDSWQNLSALIGRSPLNVNFL